MKYNNSPKQVELIKDSKEAPQKKKGNLIKIIGAVAGLAALTLVNGCEIPEYYNESSGHNYDPYFSEHIGWSGNCVCFPGTCIYYGRRHLGNRSGGRRGHQGDRHGGRKEYSGSRSGDRRGHQGDRHGGGHQGRGDQSRRPRH